MRLKGGVRDLFRKIEMQPGKTKRKKRKGRKDREEMQSRTQIATFQLTELRVWVRDPLGPLVPYHEDPRSTEMSGGEPSWALPGQEKTRRHLRLSPVGAGGSEETQGCVGPSVWPASAYG